MKYFLTLFSAAFITMAAYAEGFQVNSLSAKQSGMGHTGAAMKLGAENMYFNPAGLSFMSDNVEISTGVAAIFSYANYHNGAGYKAKTHNTASTPIYAYAGFKIYDNLAAGISFNTPYGSSLEWTPNWNGAHLIQDISLRSFYIQPTLSYRITESLSLGAGLMMAYGNVELARALMPVGSLAQFNPALADVVPVSARLNGDAPLRSGFSVGAMYDISEELTLGVSYRSKIKMRVKTGEAELSYASEELRQMLTQMQAPIPPLDQGTFKAELPLPSNLNIGLAYRPCTRLELAADMQFVGWKAYDELNLQFTENVLGGYNIKAVKNYKNTMIYRLGAEYAVTDRFDVRGGVYYDESPIRTDYYNPETPGMNKIGYSTGFSFRPYNNFSIDASFVYIQGIKRNGSYSDTPTSTFSGVYSSNALIGSLGVTVSF